MRAYTLAWEPRFVESIALGLRGEAQRSWIGTLSTLFMGVVLGSILRASKVHPRSTRPRVLWLHVTNCMII